MEGRGVFRYANFHAGAYVGYMFTEDLGIDIGANYQRSSTFYALMYDHEVDFVISAPAPLYLEVPVRIRYFYPVYKEKIYVVVYGGASLLTQFTSGSYDQGGGDFIYKDPATGTDVNATTSYDGLPAAAEEHRTVSRQTAHMVRAARSRVPVARGFSLEFRDRSLGITSSAHPGAGCLRGSRRVPRSIRHLAVDPRCPGGGPAA